jgi:tRNA(adenine34) deaminase
MSEMASHEKWMREAIEAARQASKHGEVPIGAALVANGALVAVGETQVSRRGPVAHGENCMLLDLGSTVWGLARPLVLYTTLEPCVMCVGACINATVDLIVYGSDAPPDGGTWVLKGPGEAPTGALSVVANVLKGETDELLREYLRTSTNQGGRDYVNSLLAH